MKKIHLLYSAFFLLLVVSVFSALQLRALNQQQATSPKTANTIDQYTDSLLLAYESQQERISSFSSNFEGPKISIAYLSHRNKIWDTEQLPKFSCTPQSINFDPDWASYGLPNLHVEVSQPEFITAIAEKNSSEDSLNNIKSSLGLLSEKGPLKRYSKTYKNAEGKLVKEQFDLYLTQFHITIGVKPMREAPLIKPTAEERAAKRYPKSWYQDLEFAGSKLASVNDLGSRGRESKNHRYAQLESVFKIEPNNFVNYTSGNELKPDVAVGAIITKKIKTNFDPKSGYRQAHLNPSAPGLHLDLFLDPTLNKRHEAAPLTERELTSVEQTIFNQPVYFRIQSNNIGSWDKKGLFFGTEWDDQFTITCLMPILVKGKFDVLLDSELKPTYTPQQAYFSRITFNDILPDWGLSGPGKFLSYGLIAFILIVAIIFVPQLFTLINVIFKRMAHKLKTPPNS